MNQPFGGGRVVHGRLFTVSPGGARAIDPFVYRAYVFLRSDRADRMHEDGEVVPMAGPAR
jgi:hypothetical protein